MKSFSAKSFSAKSFSAKSFSAKSFPAKSFPAIAVCAVIVAAWLGAPQGTRAFDADGTYMVHGTGQSTCREWLIDRRIGDVGAWQL